MTQGQYQDWKSYEWEHDVIDGKRCIGMKGNLDTIYDAQIIVYDMDGTGKESFQIAEWIVEAHNKMVRYNW